MSALQIAEIQEIQGTAYAVDSDGNRRLLKAGDVLFDGETVESSDGGVVSMLLADGQPFVISGQPVFLISADLVADLAPGADESALQAETLDELLAEGSLESLEDIIDSGEEPPESFDDMFAAAEDDPTASGIDFDNLAATAAGGDAGGDDGGGSTIVQADRITVSGDPTSATATESNTSAADETNATAGETNNLPEANADAIIAQEDVLLENINVLANDVDV
ncbi:MAG: retention module-containing protein, partial [Pseudomonadales bacterium]